jgi:hypothetical protein
MDPNMVFEKNVNFFRPNLAKIAENCHLSIRIFKVLDKICISSPKNKIEPLLKKMIDKNRTS